MCLGTVVLWNILNEYVPVSFKISNGTSQWETVNFLDISIKFFTCFGNTNFLRSMILLCENMVFGGYQLIHVIEMHYYFSFIKRYLDIQLPKADSCPTCILYHS